MTKVKTAVGICLTLPMWFAVVARLDALGGTLHPEAWFVIDYALLPAAAVLALVSLGLLVHTTAKHPSARRPKRLIPWTLSAVGPWGMLLLFTALWNFSRG